MSTTNLHLQVKYHGTPSANIWHYINETDLTHIHSFQNVPWISNCGSSSFTLFAKLDRVGAQPAARITTGCGDTVLVTAAFGAR